MKTICAIEKFSAHKQQIHGKQMLATHLIVPSGFVGKHKSPNIGVKCCYHGIKHRNRLHLQRIISRLPVKVREADRRLVLHQVILKCAPWTVKYTEQLDGFFELWIGRIGIVQLRIVITKYEVPAVASRTVYHRKNRSLGTFVAGTHKCCDWKTRSRRKTSRCSIFRPVVQDTPGASMHNGSPLGHCPFHSSWMA